MNEVLSTKDLIILIASKTNILTKIAMAKVCRKWNIVLKNNVTFDSISNWKNIVDVEPFSYIELYDHPENYVCIDDSTNYAEMSFMVEANAHNITYCRESCLHNIGFTIISDVYFYQNGEHDEQNWYLFGKMKHLYFFMIASCDYTGFDCRGLIKFYFAKDPYSVITFGMTNDARNLFFRSLRV